MDKEIKFEKVDVSIAVNANGYDSNKMKKDAKKRKIMTTAVAAISSAVLLTTATYAWFVLTNRPEVSQITMEAGTSGNLQIAKAEYDAQGDAHPSAEGYKTEIGFEFKEDGTVITPALRPVASINGQAFYEPVYTQDGYVKSVKGSPLDESTDTKAFNHAEKTGGQVIKKEFYLKAKANDELAGTDGTAPRKVNIRLLGAYDPASASNSNSKVKGTYVRNKDDAGTGAYATRISFSCDKVAGKVVVLEPNADYNSDAIQTATNNYNLSNDDIKKETITNQFSPYTDADGGLGEITYKLFKQNIDGEFQEDFFDKLSNDKKNTYGQSYSPVLFEIPVNQDAKITMYIWLEGTDDQCTNAIEADKIEAKFQFYSDNLENKPVTE